MPAHRALFASLGMALALLAVPAPAQAGTVDEPEITDPAFDQRLLGQVPLCPAGGPTQCAAATRIDALKVWIDAETPTTINANILLTGTPFGALTATSEWQFHATFDGTEVVTIASGAGGQNANPPPVCTQNCEAANVVGNTLVLTIAKSLYGAPVAGMELTNVFYLGNTLAPPQVPTTPMYAQDRAPNSGGVSYIFTGGAGDEVRLDMNDTDADGLNDTWEQEQFGNITAQNGTSDPDADGLNNTAEQTFGTNATNPDTDGDGILDGDEIVNGTDPLVADLVDVVDDAGGNETTENDAAADTNSTADVDDEGLLDTFTSDLAYAGSSAGGLLGVVALSLLGIAVRWGL